MSGWWAKAVSIAGDKIGLDEEAQARLTEAGAAVGGKVNGLVEQAQQTVSEMQSDTERWQQEADAKKVQVTNRRLLLLALHEAVASGLTAVASFHAARVRDHAPPPPPPARDFARRPRSSDRP